MGRDGEEDAGIEGGDRGQKGEEIGKLTPFLERTSARQFNSATYNLFIERLCLASYFFQMY